MLRFGAFMRPVTIHTGSWRYPGAYADANFNFKHIKRFAQTLERGRFDAFFMADHLSVLNMPMEMHFPPGYLSHASLKGVLKHKRQLRGGQGPSIEQLVEVGTFLCGSPETVLKRITEAHRLTGFQNFVGMMQFATLPADLTRKNIELFAEKVMPGVRALDDGNYAGLEAAVAAE